MVTRVSLQSLGHVTKEAISEQDSEHLNMKLERQVRVIIKDISPIPIRTLMLRNIRPSL